MHQCDQNDHLNICCSNDSDILISTAWKKTVHIIIPFFNDSEPLILRNDTKI